MKTISKALLGLWLFAALAAEAQVLTVVHDFAAFTNFTNSVAPPGQPI